jgi:formate hydrogenlyase subunit 3/multisubunit Na+/H+ antiporter MnhD subunit
MTADWSLPALVMLPLLAGLACVLAPRLARSTGIVASVALLLLAAGMAYQVLHVGVLEQHVGNWLPPLGIALRLDGVGAAMLLMTAIVATAISIYAARYYAAPVAQGFWPLWLFLLASLVALFLSRDLFNLYVTLELSGIAAVALTALAGGAASLTAAARYLLASLCGSLCYLLGVAITYHACGSVDLGIVGEHFGQAGSAARTAALALMTAGLLLKGALFPLHFWLPAAHSSATAPVSAALSALVVKGAFFILLRLWLEAFAPVDPAYFALLSVLGAAAIVWGSLLALMQRRAKLLIAYSTVAQLGYLFVALPLVHEDAGAWAAIVLLAASHGFAKAAMFLAAGNLQSFAGHDRVADLNRVVHRMPVTIAALGIAGVSIMGLPPSGGFNGKWILLQSATAQGRWGIASVLLIGGLLAGAYLFKLIEQAFTPGDDEGEAGRISRSREWSAFGLALVALLLGFVSMPWLALTTASGALATGGGAG